MQEILVLTRQKYLEVVTELDNLHQDYLDVQRTYSVLDKNQRRHVTMAPRRIRFNVEGVDGQGCTIQ